MLPMVAKELRELRRDRRTLALLLGMPLLLLVVFGYAASFDVTSVPTVVAGPQAAALAGRLPAQLDVVRVDPAAGADAVEDELRNGAATVGVLAAAPRPTVLVDGADLFAAKAVTAALRTQPAVEVRVLFNPDLSTRTVMVPAIIGLILAFVGTIITSLGIVRERQAGTLEVLAVMPLRAWDVILGKIAPYFAIGVVDILVITLAGVVVFDVPFRGPVGVFALGAVLFLFVVLGLGVLISTVSQNQAQAIQLAIMVMLPQILLSGMIFPISSMAAGVRWISYLLPLTYFVEVARGVMVRGAGLDGLARPLAALAVMSVVVFGLAVLRFHRDLAPASGGRDVNQREAAP